MQFLASLDGRTNEMNGEGSNRDAGINVNIVDQLVVRGARSLLDTDEGRQFFDHFLEGSGDNRALAQGQFSRILSAIEGEELLLWANFNN